MPLRAIPRDDFGLILRQDLGFDIFDAKVCGHRFCGCRIVLGEHRAPGPRRRGRLAHPIGLVKVPVHETWWMRPY